VVPILPGVCGELPRTGRDGFSRQWQFFAVSGQDQGGVRAGWRGKWQLISISPCQPALMQRGNLLSVGREVDSLSRNVHVLQMLGAGHFMDLLQL